MSRLRPELRASSQPALPNDTAYFLIQKAVAKRRDLIYGRIDDHHGGHCALGCFWEDNPNTILNTSLVDEVAAVNDSVPSFASPRQRWFAVNRWLRWKLRVLAGVEMGKTRP